MRAPILATLCVSMGLTACTTRPDYQTYYHAEQGDYASALSSAESARGGGIDGFLFGSGAGECRDYGAVITVLVAQGDFAGAREACSDYDDECAVVPESSLCFSYELGELEAASSDAELAGRMTEEAREVLHFRWLMIQDDYEGNPIERPIY